MYCLDSENHPKKQDQRLQRNNKYFPNIIQVYHEDGLRVKYFFQKDILRIFFKLLQGSYINDTKLHETRHTKQNLLNSGKKEKHERSVWMKPCLTNQQQTSAFANIFAEL